ncbi:MAG: shikimate dehydrogenase [Actinomycetota bacterium]
MTTRAAVIGSPVSHSLSPAIHSASFAALGIDWMYEAVEVTHDSLGTFMASVRGGGFGGLSVTMPLKEAVIAHLDSLDDDARTLNAVNCVSVGNGELRGHNTDGDGCCDAIESEGSVGLVGQRTVLLGAGGTARSVALALARRGADIVVVNRSRSNAEEVVRMVRDSVDQSVGIVVGDESAITEATVLVNATSVGMNSDELPVAAGVLHGGLVVLDAVYSPMDTALLRAARSAGATTVDGLWMLIHQARHQQMLWFGRAADAGLMRAESVRELARRGK